MERAEERPDWVAKRLSCTLQGTFEKITDDIRQDVCRFNELNEGSRLTARCTPTARLAMSINLCQGDAILSQPCIEVRGREHTIVVYRDEMVLFEVSQRWNEEDLECDLLIDGKVYRAWQISQKAIGKLLFPDNASR